MSENVALKMLAHIAKELSDYITEDRRPSKDEVFALFSAAVRGLSGTGMTTSSSATLDNAGYVPSSKRRG